MGIVVQNNTESANEVEFVCNKYDKLKMAKQTWESHWKELAKYFLPNKQDIWGGATAGEKRGQEIYDAIGRRSAERLASALHGMLTNPSTQWFSFSTGNMELDNDQEVAKWLQESAKAVNTVMNNSNFQPEIHEVYMDLCTLHTAHITTEADDQEIVRYKSRPIYHASISENYKNIVDTNYFESQKSVTNLIEEYGIDNLPEEVRQIQFSDPLKMYTVIQGIEPTENLPKSLRHPMHPFTSIHILKEHKVVVKKGGFEENPCAVPRYHKLSGEMYGRGPAMYALPDVKTSNQMMKTWLEGAQLAINPPLQMPDEGVLLPVKLTPGGVNYYRADSKDRIEPIMTGANPGVGHQIIELLHQSIERCFYVDQLHLVENDRMTALEVAHRRDEYLRSFSPMIGRLLYELHAPIILRTFGICKRKGGIIPAVPTKIAKAKIEVKFVSQMARAQDSVEGETALRALQTVMGMASVDPSVMDIIDVDKHTKFFYRSYGASLDLLRDEETVKEIREQRAQAQAEAQQAEIDNVNSQSAKNIAQTEL